MLSRSRLLSKSNRGKPGLEKPVHRGLRTCIACRSRRDPLELIRISGSPDGSVVVLPPGASRGGVTGRGASLCPSPSCVALFLKRKPLSRSIGRAVGGNVSGTAGGAARGTVGGTVGAIAVDVYSQVQPVLEAMLRGPVTDPVIGHTKDPAVGSVVGRLSGR